MDRSTSARRFQKSSFHLNSRSRDDSSASATATRIPPSSNKVSTSRAVPLKRSARRAAAARDRRGRQGAELVVPGKPARRQAPEQRRERRKDRRIERRRQASRHPTDSPARNGTSVAVPNGISPGTVQVSLRKVIEP